MGGGDGAAAVGERGAVGTGTAAGGSAGGGAWRWGGVHRQDWRRPAGCGGCLDRILCSLVLLWIALSQLRTHERCTHVLQELQAELEQRDADKQAMQKTIASLQCDAPAGERPSEAAELLAARKTIANLQRALREVESASGVDDELAELRADAAKLRKASAEARQAERREAGATPGGKRE